RPPVSWAPIVSAPGYSHIASEISTVPFELTARVLETLCKLNSVSLEDYANPRVLFGLRGCVLVNDSVSGRFVSSIQVKESLPDHLHMSCLFGIWDRSANTVWLTRAST